VPRYLILGKYSAEGLSSAMEEGFASREDAARQLIEALGGQFEGMYFCAALSGFDFTMMVTLPGSEPLHIMSLVASTSPAFADGGMAIELKTGSEADASAAAMREAMSQYRPPGSD